MQGKYLDNKKLSILLFIFIWVLYALVYMTKQCFSAAMAAIVSEGFLTKSQTGLISAVFYAVYAPFQLLGGKLADKMRLDLLLFIGLFGAGIINLVIFFNQNYILMLVLWGLNGAIQFGIWPAVFKIASSCLNPEHRSRGVFYICFASAFGFFLSYAVAAMISRWQNNFLLSTVVLFVLAAATPILCRLFVGKMTTEEYFEAPLTKTPEAKTLNKSHGNILIYSGIFFALPFPAARFLLECTIKGLAPTMLMESYAGVSPALGNYLSLIVIFASIIGMIILKAVYPRLLHDEAMASIVPFAVLLPFLFAVLFIGEINMWFIIIAMFIVVLIAGGVSPISSYYASAFTSFGKNGEVAGIINAVASICTVIQAYGFTLIAEHFGWNAVIWTLIGFTVFTIATLLLFRPKWLRFKAEYNL